MSSRVTVDTGRFEASHGRKPRGNGWWAFEVAGREFWADFGSFTQARRQAQSEARRRETGVVVVLP